MFENLSGIDIVVLSIPLFFLLITLELIFDAVQRRKKNPGKYRLNDAVANISCGVIDQASGVFAKVLTVGVYVLVFELFVDLRPWEMPSNWAMWVLCFFAVDLAYYWSHRLSHEVNLFWVGHVVHHQSEEYNLSVALRQGAFQKVLMLWIYLPLAMIGFPPEWFLLSIGLNLLYQFWIHTEFVDKMGWLEQVLNTPSHHRVHHGRNPEYIDKNHAGVFIIWDKLFGTFQEEKVKPTYGITTPLNTFNPVMAHVKPVVQLFTEARSMPTWSDRLRFLFARPGWYPESMGGFRPPPPVTGAEHKYDRKLPLGVNVYLLVQYAFIIGFTSFFLFNFQRFTGGQNFVFLVLVLYQVFALGDLFDRWQRGTLWRELLRQFSLMGASVWLAYGLEERSVALFVLLAALVGLAWLVILWTKRKSYE